MDLQESESACGKAVVRQALRDFYGFRAGAYIPLGEECADFRSMYSELVKRGISVAARIEMSFPELREAKTAAIIHLERPNGGHFVLLERFSRSGNRVTLYDPEVGRITVSAIEAERGYSGRALLLTGHSKKPVSRREEPRLSSSFGIVLMGILSLVRAVCAFIFFAMLADPETSLGALLPLVIFLVCMCLTCWVTGRENSRFIRGAVLPLCAGKDGQRAYREAVRAHALEMTAYEVLFDSLSFIGLVGLVYCFQEGGRLWLFLGSLILFSAAELFSRNVLAGAGSATSFSERRMVEDISGGNSAESFRRFRRDSGLYLSLALGVKVIAFGLLAVAVLGYTRSIEGATATDFISDFMLLSGVGLSVIRVTGIGKSRSEKRMCLYRLGESRADKLGAKWRRRGYNPLTDDKERKEKSADVRG